ncbi:MAG TPA: hypothetical protein VF178_10035 [Gemmatimonadaceae bacterium]
MRGTRWLPLIAVALLNCSSDSNPPPVGPSEPPPENPAPNTPGPSATVSVNDDFFSPANVIVSRAGGPATVTWQWYGSEAHSVVFDAGPPNAPAQTSGSFQRQFQTAGQFTYYCSVHGRNVMSGTVTVQ